MESCDLQPSKLNLRELCSEVRQIQYDVTHVDLQLKLRYRQQMGVLPEVGSMGGKMAEENPKV